MEIVEEIHEHVKKMPVKQARQVLDFIEFLEFKYQDTNAKNIEPEKYYAAFTNKHNLKRLFLIKILKSINILGVQNPK